MQATSAAPNDNVVERWMEARFGAPPKTKFVEVDMDELMKKAKIRDLFHVETWPSKEAVVELATQMKKCKFVASDLRKFLASFCTEWLPVALDENRPQWTPNLKSERLDEQQRSKTKKHKLLDLACWLMAWDRWALAAAMLDMLPLDVSMRYKQVCKGDDSACSVCAVACVRR